MIKQVLILLLVEGHDFSLYKTQQRVRNAYMCTSACMCVHFDRESL